MSCCDDEFLESQLAEVEAQIVLYRQAIRAVSVGQTYSLDTGQTRQSVTKANLTELKNYVQGLMNERAVLRAQLGCGGSGNIAPAF